MAAEKTARVFFALWPDEKIRALLSRAAGRLHRVCGGRRTRPETLHLTLAFLGDVELARLGELSDLAGQISGRRFCLNLTEFGHWRHNKVAWLGAGETPQALLDLAGALQHELAAAGFRSDARPYAPHITLLRNAACRELPQQREIIAWQAEEFVLVCSVPDDKGGTAYQIIGRWPLS